MKLASNDGFTLGLTVVILAILFLIVFAVLPYCLSAYQKVAYFRDYQSAIYLAESGINEKLYQLNQEPSNTADIPVTEPFGTNLGSYEVDYTSGSPGSIVSTGKVNKRQRKVSIQVRDIPEAFNKHAIYARDIDIQSSVTGNIYYDNGGFDNISIITSGHTRTPVSSIDTTVSIPTPDMFSYQSIASHVYEDGDCTSHPGTHPPVSYNGNDDSYQFNSLPGGIIFIKDVIDDDVATGGDNDRASCVLSGISLNGSLIIEGNASLTNASTIQRLSSDEPAVIADNITLNATAHNITGLLFSTGSITISGGNITGVLVGDNITVTGGSITYDSASFKENTSVYKYFTGGKRAYLPAIDSWKEE